MTEEERKPNKEEMQVVILCGGKGTRMSGYVPEDCAKGKHKHIIIERAYCLDCGKHLFDHFTKKNGKQEVMTIDYREEKESEK